MDKIAARAEIAVAEQVFPGCVIGVLNDGARDISACGTLAYDHHAVTPETVYDLASITKSIPTAVLAAILIAEGKLELSDPVKKYFSDAEFHYDYDSTIEDLLRYHVKGTQLSSLAYGTHEQIKKEALERGFDGPPGAFQYTNLPAFILGFIIEKVTGDALDTLADQHFFESLGMTHTTFFPQKDACAPTEIVEGEPIQGIPHDESARVFAKDGRAVGHAGLFSTAGDLLTFAAYMIDNPESAVTRSAQEGLGWQVADPKFMGVHAGPKVFGKTGFTGTSVMIDVFEKRALVILSNRTYPKRPENDDAIYSFRRDIADVLWARSSDSTLVAW